LAALDARTGQVLDWNPSADNTVFALAVSGNAVYAGGDFLHLAGQPRVRLAAIDAVTGLSIWSTTSGPNGRVRALAVTSNLVYTAGGFSAVGQVFLPGLAALGALMGRPLRGDPFPPVRCSPSPFPAKRFTQPAASRASADDLGTASQRWTPRQGTPLVGTGCARPGPRRLDRYASGDIIYAGGSFTDIGASHACIWQLSRPQPPTPLPGTRPRFHR